ncbi:Bug family tripartite tricarboxylate transporter substrate binding protein [Variovorax sp. LARHSF232]
MNACLARLILGATTAALAMCGPAAAQEGKIMKIVVITAAGGAGDFMARYVAERLGTKTGRTVVVENRPGAGGNIASALVARSANDGTTVLLTSNNHTVNPQIFSKAGYDAFKDFTPVTQLTRGPVVLAVGPGSQARTLREFVDASKLNAANGSYATYGIGGAAHLVGEMLSRASGAGLQHVAYRGAAPALTDTIAGQVPAVIVSLAAASAYIKSGQLRPLAVSSAARWPGATFIPTIAESGWKDAVYDIWIGIVAPAGTPADVVSQLNKDISEIVKTPEARETFARQGMEPVGSSAAEFDAYLRKEAATMEQIIKANKITAD